MRLYLLSALTAGTLLLSGCSSKQYFEPENTFSASIAESGYEGTIVDISGNGATLADGRYIGKDGVSRIILGEGYRFLYEGSAEGVLKIIGKKQGKTIREVDLHVPIVAASVKHGMIGYILNDNAFGLYRIADGKKIVENRSERTYAINTRAASPLFIDTLVVMPMLDGKLIILKTPDAGKRGGV